MKSFLLIGLDGFGKHVAMQLHRIGVEVMAVDCQEQPVNEVLPYVTSAQIGDSTNAEFLKSLGVNNFDVCMVAIGEDFQSSLVTTSLLAELGAKKVVSLATEDMQEKLLLRNGADEVLYPEKQVAKWAANRYAYNHILDYIDLDDSHAIFEVSVPENWLGKSVGQIDIRKRHNINILAVQKDGKIDAMVTPETVLTEDVTMLVLGEYRALQKHFPV